jgi:hypothetical protein
MIFAITTPLTGRDGGVSVLGDREQCFGGLPQFLDQRQVDPQTLSLSAHVTTLAKSLFEEGKVWSLEQRSCGTNRVGRVGDDDVVRVFVLWKELETVSDEDGDLGERALGSRRW